LPPGGYDLLFEGEAFLPNKAEFLQVEAAKIYVRDFSQYLGGILFVPIWGTSLLEVKPEAAADIVGAQHIGEEPTYYNSKYRCRSLKAVD
jgi:hypothetical protein